LATSTTTPKTKKVTGEKTLNKAAKSKVETSEIAKVKTTKNKVETSELAKGKTSKTAKNPELLATILDAIKNKKADNIISIDLRNVIESVSDFYIICTASNGPQIKAIAENIEHEVEEILGERPYKKEGYQSLQWVLIDYVDIVVHVMHPTARDFYKIEDLWSDGNIVAHGND
jgi:ribosome-associated protein